MSEARTPSTSRLSGSGFPIITPSHHYDTRFKEHFNEQTGTPSQAGLFSPTSNPLFTSPTPKSALKTPARIIEETQEALLQQSATSSRKSANIGIFVAALAALVVIGAVVAKSQNPAIRTSFLDNQQAPERSFASSSAIFQDYDSPENSTSAPNFESVMEMTEDSAIDEAFSSPADTTETKPESAPENPASPNPVLKVVVDEESKAKILAMEVRMQSQEAKLKDLLKKESARLNRHEWQLAEESRNLQELGKQLKSLSEISPAKYEDQIKDLAEKIETVTSELEFTRTKLEALENTVEESVRDIKNSDHSSEKARVLANELMAKVKRIVEDTTAATLSIVDEKITRAHADDIGLRDYANIKNSAEIISHSKSVPVCAAGSSIPGCVFTSLLSKSHEQQDPSIAIQKVTGLGNCWAMQGQSGFLNVRLGSDIFVESITLEHIHKSEATNINSAPRHFKVFGVLKDGQEVALLEGEYDITYANKELPHIQTFPAAVKTESPVTSVRLEIDSNHGNNVFTCLYRFRVHGTPAEKTE